jgi:uncharacterized protein YcbX
VSTGTVVGRVEQVAVYPVKSLGGCSVPEAHVDAAGLRGDRTHAVVDAATGERVTARTTPALRQVGATGDVAADTETLTAVLGRRVRLEPAGESQGEAAAVHLVSRRAVDRAAGGEVPEGCSADDPRANLLLALDGEADERAWTGRRLRVGEAVLRLTRLPKHCLGIYAEVLQPGRVAVGDVVGLDDGPDGGEPDDGGAAPPT